MDRLDPARLAAAHRICDYCLDMVPIVSGDALWTVDITCAAYQKPAPGMSARDYALNMEALGETFRLIDYGDGLRLMCSVGNDLPNPAFRKRASDLGSAFWPGDHRQTRRVCDFLIARGDLVLRSGRAAATAPVEAGREARK